MAAVRLGAKAPKFTIPATDGDFRLGAGAKENLVIYFYPRDSTPGCTTEGILGISTDTLESHRRFREKMKFPKRMNMYGRKVMGIECSTFLIDATGTLRREWRKVRVAGHAAEVLAAAREL